MSERLVITLSEEATRRYLERAQRQTQAEVDADCEPSGASIRIDLAPPYGSTALLETNQGWKEVGEAEVVLVAE